MGAFINPPNRIPLFLRIGIWVSKKVTGREIVILASTAAQVNYWARLIQALGIPPAGFSEQCDIQNNKSNI